MKPIDLMDLKPEAGEFYLKKPNKTYRLRLVTIEDERWMLKVFGEKDQLQKIFSEMRMEEICEIAFHQLDPEDKREFSAREVEDLDGEGVPFTTRVGGVKLLYSLISGIPEKIVLVRALMQTIGVSRPIQDRLAAEVDSEKKSQPTGERSSTSSLPSTDGPSTISGDAQPEKSA